MRSTIPLIDLDSPEPRLLSALRQTGSVRLSSGELDTSLINRCFEVSRQFHHRPQIEKMRWHVSLDTSIGARGYIFGNGSTPGVLGVTQASKSSTPTAENHTYEAFALGFEVDADDPDRKSASCLLGPNTWPDEPMNMKEIVSAAYAQFFQLGQKFGEVLAGELGMEPNWFRENSQKPCSEMRLLRYPPQLTDEPFNPLRPHTDFECFTLIVQSAPGLEVRAPDGRWLDVPTWSDSSVVAFLGNMVELLTNGDLESTVHRVSSTGEERLSICFFFGLDYATKVFPLPAFTESSASNYRPMVAGDHFLRTVLQDMSHLRERQWPVEPYSNDDPSPFVEAARRKLVGDESRGR